MKQFILFFLIAIALVFTSCNNIDTASGSGLEQTYEPTEKAEILVAAATSLIDVTEALAEKFNKSNPNITVNFTYGGSGSLQTQIQEGAPVDIFISASNIQIDALKEKDMIMDECIVNLLENKIVLIKPSNSGLDIKSFEDCSKDEVQLIGMGNYDSTPIGKYTKEIFTSLGILEEVSAKGNFGTDVRQVLTWVEAGEVDCGIVYQTDATISDNVKIVCESHLGSHSAVIYPVAILKNANNIEDSQKFLEFLSSNEAKIIFEKYGFTTIGATN